jgi:hypothetical protein
MREEAELNFAFSRLFQREKVAVGRMRDYTKKNGRGRM